MEYTDHKGNKFPSLSAMGRAWGIPSSTLQNRIVTRKLPIEIALTMTPEDAKKQKHGCTDHLGNEYPSKVEMCEKYGITTKQYFGRIRLGWSVEKALTTPADYVPLYHQRLCDP